LLNRNRTISTIRPCFIEHQYNQQQRGICTSTEEWNFYWKIRRTSIKWICDFVMALSFIIFQNSRKQ
ncbi:hypothetical protein T05_5254, partial [Trichinella murrelli]